MLQKSAFARVCKRWNSLIKTRMVCRDLDLTFVALNAANLKRALKHCKGTLTRSLSFRAPCKRFEGDNRNRQTVTASKCKYNTASECICNVLVLHSRLCHRFSIMQFCKYISSDCSVFYGRNRKPNPEIAFNLTKIL